MNPKRRNRLFIVLFLIAGSGATLALVLLALNENLNLFYPPDQVVNGEAPINTPIRAGGMVLDGSVERAVDGLDVAFVLTDYQGAVQPIFIEAWFALVALLVGLFLVFGRVRPRDESGQ